MPELPEVETVRAQLAPLVEGRTLERLEVADQRWCVPLAPDELARAVEGRTTTKLGRRGKYLIWTFDDEVHLLIHLRMTGALLYDPRPDARFHRVTFELGDGHTVWFCDQRRFGTGELALGDEGLAAFFAPRLGVEPLSDEFTPEVLRELARGRRSPAKAFLLDQTKVAGVGNIYADEALFRAKIHPLRPIGTLRRPQLEALHEGVVAALTLGLANGGSTIENFQRTDGTKGSMQDEFLVHTRKGEPCPRCGRTIVKMVAAGRGTYVCEGCQKRPRALRTA